jgi:hypothetical protein
VSLVPVLVLSQGDEGGALGPSIQPRLQRVDPRRYQLINRRVGAQADRHGLGVPAHDDDRAASAQSKPNEMRSGANESPFR